MKRTTQEILSALWNYNPPDRTIDEQRQISVDIYHAAETIETLLAEGKVRDELLDRCRIALDDWINTYAAELCDEERVQEAGKRIADNGGTLAYVARLIADIRNTTVDKGQRKTTVVACKAYGNEADGIPLDSDEQGQDHD